MKRKEIWLPIKNYEGLYEISNLGNVKSLSREYSRICIKPNNKNIKKYTDIYTKKEIFLKLTLYKKDYIKIKLCKNTVEKNYSCHRLVAIAFIPNPNNYPQVNHKDGDKQNNNVENLEWCNNSQNIKHAFAIGLSTPPMLNKHGKDCINSKPVIQYDINLNLIKEYESITDASKDTNYNHTTISYACLAYQRNGKYKPRGDFIWRFKIQGEIK